MNYRLEKWLEVELYIQHAIVLIDLSFLNSEVKNIHKVKMWLSSLQDQCFFSHLELCWTEE